MKEIILITGCCGQIGSNLVKKLKNYDAEIIGLDISPPSEELKKIFDDKGKFISCNLLDLNELKKNRNLLEPATKLVHLASVVEDSNDVLSVAEKTIRLNLFSTINLLKILPNLKQICFSSSMMVYGSTKYSPIDESHITNPINLYGLSKKLTEDFLKIYSKEKSLDLSILRFTSIYGPGKYSGNSAKRAIPNFIRVVIEGKSPNIFGNYKEKRDYLFLDDAIEAIYLTLKKPFSDIINIGSGESVTILELASTICKIINPAIKPKIEGEAKSNPLNYLLNISKAKELIGFDPNVKIVEGLKLEIKNEIQ